MYTGEYRSVHLPAHCYERLVGTLFCPPYFGDGWPASQQKHRFLCMQPGYRAHLRGASKMNEGRRYRCRGFEAVSLGRNGRSDRRKVMMIGPSNDKPYHKTFDIPQRRRKLFGRKGLLVEVLREFRLSGDPPEVDRHAVFQRNNVVIPV